jgi:hypothetical protein
VTVCEQLDGTIRLRYQGRELAWEELPERPTPAAAAWEGTFLLKQHGDISNGGGHAASTQIAARAMRGYSLL